jgi:protoheme IX farnesyltransferase
MAPVESTLDGCGMSEAIAGRAIRGPQVLADYLSLVKPGIMALLVVTEIGALIAAARGWPGLRIMAAALVGGALCSGGAAAINCWFDRDIDALMDRTCARPVPAGRISPRHALIFGCVLGAAGVGLLAVGANLLSAALAVAGGLFYVLVYTAWLKRSSSQNIVIGGAAGSFPPLVGWSAATHSLAPAAIALAVLCFFWTPPHFWALSLLLERQYRAVGVPMLPVVRGAERTRRAIVAYSLVLLAASLVPGIWLGDIYLIAAALLGAILIGLAVMALRERGRRWAALLFHYSIAYLGLLFVAVPLSTLVDVRFLA